MAGQGNNFKKRRRPKENEENKLSWMRRLELTVLWGKKVHNFDDIFVGKKVSQHVSTNVGWDARVPRGAPLATMTAHFWQRCLLLTTGFYIFLFLKYHVHILLTLCWLGLLWFILQRLRYDQEEEIRNGSRRGNVNSSSRANGDVHNHSFETSSNRRQWQEVWRSYGNSQPRGSERARSNRYFWGHILLGSDILLKWKKGRYLICSRSLTYAAPQD